MTRRFSLLVLAAIVALCIFTVLQAAAQERHAIKRSHHASCHAYCLPAY